MGFYPTPLPILGGSTNKTKFIFCVSSRIQDERLQIK